jgi:hypothetical protein
MKKVIEFHLGGAGEGDVSASKPIPEPFTGHQSAISRTRVGTFGSGTGLKNIDSLSRLSSKRSELGRLSTGASYGW